MQSLLNIIFVGLGGFMGSALRYLVAGWINGLFKSSSLPLGTAVVNVAGCLVIGLAGGWFAQPQAPSPHLRLLFVVGLLGGFTTFSAFGWETITLLREQQPLLALANVGGQLVLGLGAVALGFAGSRLLWG